MPPFVVVIVVSSLGPKAGEQVVETKVFGCVRLLFVLFQVLFCYLPISKCLFGDWCAKKCGWFGM